MITGRIIKTYKHRPTGEIYTKCIGATGYRKDQEDNLVFVPENIVEKGSDWEEVVEEWPIGTVVLHASQPRNSYKKIETGEWQLTSVRSTVTDKSLRLTGWLPDSVLSKSPTTEFKFGDVVQYKNSDLIGSIHSVLFNDTIRVSQPGQQAMYWEWKTEDVILLRRVS